MEYDPDERRKLGEFTERLLAALPHLRARYEATVAECAAEGLDEVAPSEFLFWLTRELLDRYRGDAPAGREPLMQLAELLEVEYGTDFDIDLHISGCVLPLFLTATDPDPADLLGPKLAAEVAEDRGWRAAPADAALVERLVAAVPALEPLAQENTFGDHGDVLVHGFLGDVVRLLVDDVEAGRLDEVHAVLEDAWGGDADEAIAVSFVENMPWPHEPGTQLITLLGPRLRAELKGQRRR